MAHTLRQNYHKSFETDITASTTQTQGNGVLTGNVNEVRTIANTNDVVTLPTAREGDEISIINNSNKNLQIFPASGDNLGNGTNLSTTLELNEEIKFFAIDDTAWHIEETTEIFHAEIHDEDNTDVFTISKTDEKHCYHTNGIVIGDILGWTFQNGGTAPIASIADGTSGDITVTTTGVHSLAIGDVISQNNLTDSNYVGVFIVKTVPTTTTYTVTATWGATGTGTMNQAATLTCDPIAIGSYALTYDLSAIGETSNDIFKFFIYQNTTKIPGTKRKKKFNTAGDLYDVTKGAIVHVEASDKISLVIENTSTAGNITLEDKDIRLIKL